MPLKSKAQERKLWELEQQGKVPKGTVDKWRAETPSLHALPEHAARSARGRSKTIQTIKSIGGKKRRK